MLGKRYVYDDKPIIHLSKRQFEARNRTLENMKNKYRFVNVNCECGDNDYAVLSEKDRYGLPVKSVICKKCGLIYQNPHLDDESIRDFYSYIYRDLYESSNVSKHFISQIHHGDSISNWILNKLGYIPRSVIEIGCGAGGNLKAFQKIGAKTLGVDFDKNYIDFGRKRGLNLKLGGAEAAIPNQAELIILSHVFEHFSNIEKELNTLKSLLIPEGFLYIEVPGIYNLRPYSYDFLKSLQNAHNYQFTLWTLKQVLNFYGWELVYGNQNIFSLFKYLGIKKKPIRNYYSQIKKYLLYSEKMRPIKQLTTLGFYKQYAEHLFRYLIK